MLVSRRPLLLLPWAALAAACGEVHGPAPLAPVSPDIEALEREMFERLNQERRTAGLPPLTYAPDLAEVGRSHSMDMRDRRFFAHDSPTTGSLEDRLDQAGARVLAARENLGEGPDVAATHAGLMNSPGHRANILATDVTHVGIGIVRGGVAVPQNLLATQVFGAPFEEVSPDDALAEVLRRIAEARKKGGAPALAPHARLEELARAHVGRVPDDLATSGTKPIADDVIRELGAAGGLRGVTLATALFLHPSLYEPSGAVLSPQAKAVGAAMAPGRDPRGRPALKMLVLLGL